MRPKARENRFTVYLKPSAQKYLEQLPDKEYARVAARIALLGVEPYAGKQLKGDFQGYFSLRVWPFRVIYFIQNKELIVFVVKIAQRKDAY